MAITHYYVDPAAGSDHKGASFTDGAFTVADMTLTKTGAFASAVANDKLYLTDNGSGRVTPGIYKISSKTSDNAVVLATSPKSGATDPIDVVCNQGTGAVGTPWATAQHALNNITQGTAGDQINIKAGGTDTLSAALVFTTYGAPNRNKPIIFRGYTTAANDGGIGVLSGGGACSIDGRGGGNTFTIWADMRLTNVGARTIVDIGGYGLIYHCQIDTSTAAYGVNAQSAYSRVIGCYIHDCNDGIGMTNANLAAWNYIVNCTRYGIYVTGEGPTVLNNVINCAGVNQYGIYHDGNGFWNCIGNTVYNSTAGTKEGIRGNTTSDGVIVINNIVEGWSGTGGDGILATKPPQLSGNNASYNNATPFTLGGYIDTGNDSLLGASVFTNPAGANFAVSTDANVKAAALPALFNGSSTNDYVDKGAAQRQEPAAGGASHSAHMIIGSRGITPHR